MNGEQIHVLLVEDNEAHAELVLRSLREHRVANRIFHVSDGAEALDYLHNRGAYADRQAHPRPHMVLLDLRLPKVSGLEVLEQIKSDAGLSTIPVVILTTSQAEVDVASAYRCRANSYLVKPMDYEKFIQLMEELGYFWLGWNQFPWPPGAHPGPSGRLPHQG
ncbi:MAG: response regulator [Gemmatimonadota bacterium]|nr:response regulator [Gemmatimonadota bacterium]